MRRAVICLLLAAAGLPSCGKTSAVRDPSTITVFAASSLTAAFRAAGAAFARAHPGSDVVFDFDSSSSLARQIVAGASADVFASADEQSMQTVVNAGATVAAPQVFATNTLVIAVPAGNPSGVRTLGDLARATVAICAASAPCGRYAGAALRDAGVTLRGTVSREANVKGVATKVATGEADAGIVYATDVLADKRLAGVAIPSAPAARYPIAPLTGRGREFTSFILASDARSLLAAAGFKAP